MTRERRVTRCDSDLLKWKKLRGDEGNDSSSEVQTEDMFLFSLLTLPSIIIGGISAAFCL